MNANDAGLKGVLKRAWVRFWDRGSSAGIYGTERRDADERGTTGLEARIPPWRLRAVPMMLRDEFVQYGLQIIEGPILSNLRVEIVAAGEEGSVSRVQTSSSAKKSSSFPPKPGQAPPNGKKPPFPPKKTNGKQPSGESLAASFSLQEGEGAPPKKDGSAFVSKNGETNEDDDDEDDLSEEDVQALNEPTGLPPEVEAYIRDNLNLFIDRCLEVPLGAMRYGFAPAEPCFDWDDDVPYLHHLESIDPFVCDPFVDMYGRFEGIKINRYSGDSKSLKNFMGYPKAAWFVHRRHIDRWFGESRLRGAYPSFFKKWSVKGYGELLRIWMTKNAFDSGVLWYDPQEAPRIGGEINRDPRQVAIDMLNQKMSGSGLVLSSAVDPLTQAKKFDYQAPQTPNPPSVLFESEQESNNRILLAMGVSPELAHNFSTGGYGSASGRAIPETAFYSTLVGVIKPIIVEDFKEQIMDPLLMKRFGKRFNYRLVVLPLIGDDESSSTDPEPFQPEDVPGGDFDFGSEGSGKPNDKQKQDASNFAKSRFGAA